MQIWGSKSRLQSRYFFCRRITCSDAAQAITNSVLTKTDVERNSFNRALTQSNAEINRFYRALTVAPAGQCAIASPFVRVEVVNEALTNRQIGLLQASFSFCLGIVLKHC